MRDKKSSEDGYLTVFFSLTLTVMISLCLVLIFGVKRNSARLTGECVTDVALHDVFAEYHRELWNQYDLLFIDTGYGTSSFNYQNTKNHLMGYVLKNTEEEGIKTGFAESLHNLTLQDVEIAGVRAACDEGGKALKIQATDIMKQKIGIPYIEELENRFLTVEKYGLHTRNLLEEEKEVVGALQEWNENFSESVLDEKVGSGKIISVWKSGILVFVCDAMEVSAQTVTLSNYVSHRERLTGGGMSSMEDFEDSFMDRLFFQEYIMAYTGHVGKEKENGLLQYQTEYILSGKESDEKNLEEVAKRILYIRGAANMISLLKDEGKRASAEVLGNALAMLCSTPEAGFLYTLLVEIFWSMAEAICDVAKLIHGKKVPIIKTPSEWHLSIEGILSGEIFQGWRGDADMDEGRFGLTYEDYLRLLLCFENEETMTYRLMDIMEMDIRQTPGNGNFRMDGCIDGLRAIFTYFDGNGDSFEVERSYTY